MTNGKRTFTAFLFVFLVTAPVFAQEGMWPMNMVPEKALMANGFTPTPAWIEHVQKAAVRLPNCSASFVSSQGLVVTNGHCAEEAVQKLSTATNNYYEKGFYAKTLVEELKTNLTLMNLQTIDNVTQTIIDSVAKTATNMAADARQAEIDRIERESSFATGMKCEVVELYQGAQYHNYCYKVYTDVRLVFSSEKNAWFFGGDADNFEYPRYTMDIAFLRAYENDKPAQVKYYFKWSQAGPSEKELVFMAGHPGSTNRLYTSAALKTERDVWAPFILELFIRQEIAIQQFALKGAEARRISESDLFSAQNTRKLFIGQLRGLQDPKLIKEKEMFDLRLVSDAQAHSRGLFAQVTDGLQMIYEAQPTKRELMPKRVILNFVARALKDQPQDKAYAEAMLENNLRYMIEIFGAETPLIVKAMNGLGPAELAHKAIYEWQANDMDAFMKVLSGIYIGINSPYQQAMEQERQGYNKLANALFTLYGTDRYPDATFTLRLAFGRVLGYVDTDGKYLSPWTTIGGAFTHAQEFKNEGAYNLPNSWRKAKASLNLLAPFNFVATLDITGGNSGSPVFNRNLELYGLAFDSNIYGLVTDYDYNYDSRARAIMVHSAGILELLRVAYRASPLVRELIRP